MPKRPRSHNLEELSRGRLRDIFSRLGWVVWDLYPDYGEDLLVRIFVDGSSTHYSFFVQAKATDHIDRYMSKDKQYLSFPIDIDHLEHWGQFWEPVLLTIWDATSDITYWGIIQDLLDKNAYKSKKKSNISIPIANILNNDGLKNIFEQTRSRFRRFELTCDGVYALMKHLEEKHGGRVEYKPGAGVMCISYNAIDGKIGDEHVILLGDTATIFDELLKKFNMTPEGLLAYSLSSLWHSLKDKEEDGSN